MSAEKIAIGDATLWHADCREILPTLPKFDAVVTDPPYPDYLAKEYGYQQDILPLINISKGMVFWTAKEPFPCDYSAIHVWDKKTGCGSEYERIFEIGGKRNYKVFRCYLINSTVAASYTGDEFFNHPSQKPVKLMREVILYCGGETVFDPFMGSGTTGVACAQIGKQFTGIERERKYFDIACERIAAAQAQGRLFAPENAPKPVQDAMPL